MSVLPPAIEEAIRRALPSRNLFDLDDGRCRIDCKRDLFDLRRLLFHGLWRRAVLRIGSISRPPNARLRG
jgi:hypothetical protein